MKMRLTIQFTLIGLLLVGSAACSVFIGQEGEAGIPEELPPAEEGQTTGEAPPIEGDDGDKDGEDMANDNGTDNEDDDGGKGADDLEALGGGGFVWRREGGIAGFCDVVTASVDGEATVGTCATDPPAIQNRPTLTAAQEDELSGMVARLTSFTEVQKDPATADALTISIYSSGDGDAQPTDEDIAAIQALALEILASPPIQ